MGTMIPSKDGGSPTLPGAPTASKATTTFAAAGDVSNAISIEHGGNYSYMVTGTFVATALLRKSIDGGQTWQSVLSLTAPGSGTIQAVEHPNRGRTLFQWIASAYTSGDPVVTIVGVPISETMLIPVGVFSKAGSASGWVTAAADALNLSTLPASKTAAILVVPIPRLKPGQIITGFGLVGQIESGGNTVTLDADFRKLSAAAADVVDASVDTMTQISVTADTALTADTTLHVGMAEVVAADSSYYMKITGTTDTATDIALQGIVLYLATLQ